VFCDFTNTEHDHNKDARGVCPTACVCSEYVKLTVTPGDAKTVEQIADAVKMVTGASDVTVVKKGNTFEVTVKGDAEVDSNSSEVNTKQSFADATSSKLSASGAVGQVEVVQDVLTDATADRSSASIVTLGSLALAVIVAALI
jgi:hypothetical protein